MSLAADKSAPETPGTTPSPSLPKRLRRVVGNTYKILAGTRNLDMFTSFYRRAPAPCVWLRMRGCLLGGGSDATSKTRNIC